MNNKINKIIHFFHNKIVIYLLIMSLISINSLLIDWLYSSKLTLSKMIFPNKYKKFCNTKINKKNINYKQHNNHFIKTILGISNQILMDSIKSLINSQNINKMSKVLKIHKKLISTLNKKKIETKYSFPLKEIYTLSLLII